MSLRPTGDRTSAQITSALQAYYDGDVDRRDGQTKQDWKLDERAAFLDRLRAVEATTLLEVGAGTGQDSAYFQNEGLDVTAIDLSPEMVTRIRAKGIRALVRDVRDLGSLPGPFDAVYTVNALLHVPNAELAAALTAIRAVVKPGALFYLGVWGATEDEEGFANDRRFFSFRSDHTLMAYGKEQFDLMDFHVIHAGTSRFQSMTLVNP